MKRFFCTLTAFALGLTVAGSAWAADVKTVSLAATDTPVRDALRSFAAQSGATILIGSEVAGRVAMQLDKVPLENALTVAASTTNNRWSRLVVPADKAASITPETAAALVAAADTLAALPSVTVQDPGGLAVTVGPPSPDVPKGSVAVYLVQTKVDPTAIKAAREQARAKTAAQAEVAMQQAAAAKMSPVARQDPQLVRAYTQLQAMQPDQIAMLAREYLETSTPEQREAIGEAMRRQHEQAHPEDRPQQ